MAACNEHCVLAVECINGNIKDLALTAVERKNADDKLYQLLLCNSIGTTVDCKFFELFRKLNKIIIKCFIFYVIAKYTEVCPNFVGINSNYVAIASKDEILLWHYHTPKVCLNIIKCRYILDCNIIFIISECFTIA